MPIHVAHNVGATHRDVVDLAGDARLDARPKGCARSGEFCRCRRCETTSSSSTSKLYSGLASGRGWYRSHGTVASERHECFYGVSLCSQVMIMRMRHRVRFNLGVGWSVVFKSLGFGLKVALRVTLLRSAGKRLELGLAGEVNLAKYDTFLKHCTCGKTKISYMYTN